MVYGCEAPLALSYTIVCVFLCILAHYAFNRNLSPYKERHPTITILMGCLCIVNLVMQTMPMIIEEYNVYMLVWGPMLPFLGILFLYLYKAMVSVCECD
jgi:hypothetical protein